MGLIRSVFGCGAYLWIVLAALDARAGVGPAPVATPSSSAPPLDAKVTTNYLVSEAKGLFGPAKHLVDIPVDKLDKVNLIGYFNLLGFTDHATNQTQVGCTVGGSLLVGDRWVKVVEPAADQGDGFTLYDNWLYPVLKGTPYFFTEKKLWSLDNIHGLAAPTECTNDLKDGKLCGVFRQVVELKRKFPTTRYVLTLGVPVEDGKFDYRRSPPSSNQELHYLWWGQRLSKRTLIGSREIIANPKLREQAAGNCLGLVQWMNSQAQGLGVPEVISGLNLDYEYPATTEELGIMVSFIESLRSGILPAVRDRFILSMDLAATPLVDLAAARATYTRLGQVVNQVTVMYYEHGAG